MAASTRHIALSVTLLAACAQVAGLDSYVDGQLGVGGAASSTATGGEGGQGGAGCACDPECESCVDGVCVPAEAGTTCADTGRCDGVGNCAEGALGERLIFTGANTQQVVAVAVADDTIFVALHCNGATSFGSAGSKDCGPSQGALIVALDLDLNERWTQRIHSPGAVVIADIDARGDQVLVVGSATDAFQVGAASAIGGAGGSDGLVVLLDAVDGEPSIRCALGDEQDQSVRGGTITEAGHAIAITYAGEVGLEAQPSAGMEDILVAMLDDSEGCTSSWTKQLGDENRQQVERIIARSTGELVIAGQLDGSLVGGLEQVENDMIGAYAIFDAALSPGGVPIGGRAYGPSTGGYDLGKAAAPGPEDEVAVAGHVQGGINWGEGEQGPVDALDYVLAVRDVNDALIYSKRYGTGMSPTASGSSPPALAFDPQGNLLLTGAMFETTQLGSLPELVNADTGREGFVLKLSPGGEELWAVHARAGAVVRAVATLADGRVVFGGDFETGAALNEDSLPTAQGSLDGFIAIAAP